MNEATRRQMHLCRKSTDALVVGQQYFLNCMSGVDGAWVKVLSKSTEMNNAGWPSIVEYVVLEEVGSHHTLLYKPGCKGTCNATNLYYCQADAKNGLKRVAY